MTERVKTILTTFTLTVAALAKVTAADLYVDPVSPHPSEPYNAWTNAAHTIQEAVDFCDEYDTIRIAKGTYTAGSSTNFSFGATNVLFLADKLVNLVGEGATHDDVIIDGEGLYRGIHIRRLRASTTPMLMQNLTIRNCRVEADGAKGGGIYVEVGNGSYGKWTFNVDNCLFLSNTVVSTTNVNSLGGALYCSESTPQWVLYMTDSLLRGNISTNSHTPAASEGGAIYLRTEVGKYFINCTFEDNGGCAGGAGIYSHRGTLIVSNSIFRGNWAPHSANINSGGGAINSSSVCNPYIWNSLFVNNSAVRGAAFWAMVQGDSGGNRGLKAYNCTFVNNDNHAIGQRPWGVNQDYQPAVRLWNSIFYSNKTVDLSPGTKESHHIHTITNCFFTSTNEFNFQFVHSGLVIAENPGFVDFENGDYRLRGKSPCVNAGVNMDWMEGATDLDGNPRINWGKVDLGAYEHEVQGISIFIR